MTELEVVQNNINQRFNDIYAMLKIPIDKTYSNAENIARVDTKTDSIQVELKEEKTHNKENYDRLYPKIEEANNRSLTTKQSIKTGFNYTRLALVGMGLLLTIATLLQRG